MAKNKKKGNKKPKQPETNSPEEVAEDIAPTETEAVEAPDVTEQTEQQGNELEAKPEISDNQVETTTIKNGPLDNGISIASEIDHDDDASNIKDNELESEITKLKKELEEERSKNTNSNTSGNDVDDMMKLKEERDHFEEQYTNLLSRISQMKTVFSKMKEAQEELETVREQLGEYESQNLKLKNKVSSLNSDKDELKETVGTLNKELSNLENENESLQSRVSECEEYLKSNESKIESSSHIHDSELKTFKEENDQLKSQVQELSIILDTHKQDISGITNERDDIRHNLKNSESTKKELENTIQKIEKQIEESALRYKEELNQNGLEINSLRVQLDTNIESNKKQNSLIDTLKDKLNLMEEDVSMKDNFEKQTKDQILQIGKLRHEAIILNEHLKKALSMLKQSSDSESVDKELISNLLISFVSIPRGDPKKFEVLELLSSFLNWDDEKMRQAGLMLDSDKNGNVLQSNSRTQSFVALWTDFLEKESEK